MASATVAAVAAMVLLGAAMFVSYGGSATTTVQQTELLNLWDRPYHTVTTTTMLWNAASDDAGSTSYGRNDDDDTEYDTYGKSSSLSDDGDNSGDTELADTDWGTHSYSHDSNDGIQMPDTQVHSWDSGNSVALKQQLKKMFSKGINRVSKQIADKAEAQESKGFYSKWAKVAGKKISAGDKQIGLDSKQAKLYKEAEASEVKEQAKKAPFIKAVAKVVSKEQKKSAEHNKSADKVSHDQAVKAKLRAADKLATKLAEHKKKAASGPPKADPGKIGSKSAVKALKEKLDNAHGHKAKAEARKKMAALEQQIKNDFKSVTSFARKVKTSLPPLKA